MADDLTPPFEEPAGSSTDECDEALVGAAEQVDFYDLNMWLDGGDLAIGFTGMLKVMREDGSMVAFHVGVGVSEFEAIGLHRKILRQLEDDIDMDSYWKDE